MKFWLILLTTTTTLLSSCYAQFNLKASTDNGEVANKTICMSSGKARLLFPPDNSCVFTFKGGILTAYTNNGVLFNEGEQLSESDTFRGSQILFRNSVLDPPNHWQFTACPEEESNTWSVWMDGSCEGGVVFEAVLTPLDDAVEEEEATEAESAKSEADSAKSSGTTQSCDCDPDSLPGSTSTSPTVSTKTITEIVTVTGQDDVTEVTTTRTITQGRVSKVALSPGVVTVTEHVTSTIQATVPGVDERVETAKTPAETSPETAPPTHPEQPAPSPNETPAWNVGAPSDGVEANPTPNQQGERPAPTIWWTQPSSPWWTQQTQPWWTPESVASSAAASSAVSGTVSGSSAQENGSKRVPTALEALLALFTVHIALL